MGYRLRLLTTALSVLTGCHLCLFCSACKPMVESLLAEVLGTESFVTEPQKSFPIYTQDLRGLVRSEEHRPPCCVWIGLESIRVGTVWNLPLWLPEGLFWPLGRVRNPIFLRRPSQCKIKSQKNAISDQSIAIRRAKFESYFGIRYLIACLIHLIRHSAPVLLIG